MKNCRYDKGTGNREQGTGYREQVTGNRLQGTGYREQGTLLFVTYVSFFSVHLLIQNLTYKRKQDEI
ncbi:MAG: hypothetical protein ACK4Y3_21905 [Dolichospermum sp.]